MTDITNQQVKEALSESYDDVILTLQKVMRHAHDNGTYFQDRLFNNQSANVMTVETADMTTEAFTKDWLDTSGHMNIPTAPIESLHMTTGDIINTSPNELLHFTHYHKNQTMNKLTDENCEAAITAITKNISKIGNSKSLESLRNAFIPAAYDDKYYGGVNALLSLQFLKIFTEKLGIEGIDCTYNQPIDPALKTFFPELIQERNPMQSGGSNASSIEKG